MIRNILLKFGNILLRPFKQHFLFFSVICTLTVCAHVMAFFTTKYGMNLNAAIAFAIHCVSLSYIVTLLISFICNKAVRQILQALFILYAAVDFTINFYCAFHLCILFDNNIALPIKETNPGEIVEFFSTMVPMWIILAVAIVFFLFAFLGWHIKRRNLTFNLGPKLSLLAMGITSICILGNLNQWGIWRYGPIGPLYALSQNDNPVDLKDYYSHPSLTFAESNELPTNVVLIVGESYSRSHSSIYGYEKLTNPQLTALKDSAMLFSFDSINSPANSTVLSIRLMLSTYDLPNEKEDKKWYEYISLIELMKESGYESYWFGNQGQHGQYNGSIRTYAQTCDHPLFFEKDDVDNQFDVVLLDSSYQYINQIGHKNHNFIVYHMKGSHFKYSKRYPDEFAIFTVNDYITYPESHRVTLSSYDNSILYNDYIVSQIIELFKDSESIVIYLPDHGQVMYRNPKDPDYYAHGRKQDPVDYALGIDIPFFIYASPLYQQKHPETMKRIKDRQENPITWNSDNLPYFIMDLIGVKEINGETIRTKSILN